MKYPHARLPLLVLLACLALVAGCKPKSEPRPSIRTGSIEMAPTGAGVGGLNNGWLPQALNGTAVNQVLQATGDGGTPFFAQLTQDQIGAAFTVSLAFASGAGPFEVGQTATPTYNATPATNAVTVTGSTITDNQSCPGCPQSISSANPLSAPSTGHTYALTTPGTVTVTVAETLISTGTTRSGSASLSFDDRWFYGVDSQATCTTLTASSGNATLAGCSPTATLTGALAASFVGVSFSVSPSTQYVYAAFPHVATQHAFKDQNGFTFALYVTTASYSFTNQYGQVVVMDIYTSTNPLSASYTVTVTSWNDPRDYEPVSVPALDYPANDNGYREAVPA